MAPHPAATDPEALLEHLDWVRELALRLVKGDSALADDLRQETWLAAQRSTRPNYVPLRAWLAGLVRNLAFKRERTAVRRRRRELAAARSETVASTVEIVDRAATQEQVVRCVLELDEPYRSTLMLRYFDQLTPRDIARQQAIPLATVKTRLRRGLEQLRARLAERFGGEGAARSRLLAVVIAPLGMRTPKVAPWVPATLAAVGVGIVTGVVLVTGSHDVVGDVDVASAAPRAEPLLSTLEPPSRVTLEAAVDEAAVAPLAAEAAAAGSVWAARVHGVVLDLGARPVAGVELAFQADEEDAPRAVRARSDLEGRFVLDVPPMRGSVAIQGHAWEGVLTPLVFPGQGEIELVALVAPRTTVIGRVSDPANRAVAGAEVGFLFDEDPASGLDRLARRSRIGSWVATSDHAGEFELSVPQARATRLRVRALGFRTREIPVDVTTARRIEVRLMPVSSGDVVQGRVVDALGAPVAGAWVGAEGATKLSDEEGRFQLFFARRPRPVTLTAVAEGRAPASARWDPSEAPAPVELRLPGPAPIARGRVLDSAGVPVAGVCVRVHGGTPFGRIPRQVAGLTSWEPVTVEDLVTKDPFHPWVVTGADGEFALATTGPGHTLAFHDPVTLARLRGAMESGSAPADFVLDGGAATRRVRCRAVGPDGEPVAGAYVTPFRTPLPDEPVTMRQYGARQLTGSDGRAEWPALVVRDLQFHVTGPPGWFLHDFVVPAITGDEVTLPVSRESGLRLVFPARDHPQRFRLLDASGQVMQLAHGSGEVNLMEMEGVVGDDGRSPMYGVPAQATTLVLLSGGVEVSRVAIELTPGEVATLDF